MKNNLRAWLGGALAPAALLVLIGAAGPLSNNPNTGNLAGAVDGRFTGLSIENTQADAGSSLNETAEILFKFAGKTAARISADKLSDYTTGDDEDARLSFWVDSDGTLTQVAHFMPDGLMLLLGDSRIRFAGTAGGGGQSIQYKDLSGSNRAALLFPGSDIVALVNRTENGTVEIRANTSTGGGAGEVTVAIFSDTKLDLIAGQIQFPATQLAVSEVNTLDDYAEGTFTPTAIFAAGSGTITYVAQVGRYTKIGDIVFFTLELKTLSIASRTGDMTIGGLPFTSDVVPAGAINVGIAEGLNLASAGMTVTGNVKVSASTIALRVWDLTTGTSFLQHTEWTDDGRVVLSGHYNVPS